MEGITGPCVDPIATQLGLPVNALPFTYTHTDLPDISCLNSFSVLTMTENSKSIPPFVRSAATLNSVPWRGRDIRS